MIQHIRFASGSSIGALYCLYLALKIPIDVIESDYVDLLVEINSTNKLCMDKSKFGKFLQNKGLTSVDFMAEPAKKYMKTKYGTEDMTFMELSKRTGVNIYITTTSVNTGKRCLFSLETTPNASVLKAVCASMTVPLLFEPVYIDGEYHIDGVISFDLPIDVFENVPKDNLLACLIVPYKQANINCDTNAEFTFLNYIFTCLRIFIINLVYQSVAKYIDSDDKHILKLDDLPYDNSFKFDIGEDYVKVKLCQDDVDNLILKGFIEMTNHMKKRNIVVSE
jgi:predicted patatin/cPLA2 family phospholipase